jgi:hypothetical protein
MVQQPFLPSKLSSFALTFLYIISLYPIFHNIAVLVLGLYSTYARKQVAFDLLNLPSFASDLGTSSQVPFISCKQYFILLCG